MTNTNSLSNERTSATQTEGLVNKSEALSDPTQYMVTERGFLLTITCSLHATS